MQGWANSAKNPVQKTRTIINLVFYSLKVAVKLNDEYLDIEENDYSTPHIDDLNEKCNV